MTNEDIISAIVDFATEQTNSLSDEDFIEVYNEVASQLETSANAKQEELG